MTYRLPVGTRLRLLDEYLRYRASKSRVLPGRFGIARPERVVAEHHVACIEGFPRSANTLAFHVFLAANPGTWVSHHVHRPLQLVRAHELEIPCAAIVREPVDAVSSLLVFEREVRVDQALRNYRDFYSVVLHLDSSVAVCRFNDVIEHPSIVAESLNARFDTEFVTKAPTEDQLAALVERIEDKQRSAGADALRISTPNAERAPLISALRNQVSAHPRCASAETIYAQTAARAYDPGRHA